MRTKIWAVGLVLLVALGWWWTRAAPVANLGPRQGPIVVLGDSLAAGNGSASRLGFVGLLEQRLKITLVNKGIPGNTTRQGLERLDRDVLSLEPALVVLELGGNDFLQHVPTEETFANLDEIVRRIQARGAPVLLLGVQGGVLQDPAAARYRELASQRQTAYVPNIMDGIWTNPALKDDTIHPNDAGYKLIADRIEPVLGPLVRTLGR